MAIAEELRALKEKRGITVSQWSAASGVPQDTINKILSGTTRNPSYQTVCDLISALGGSVEVSLGHPAGSETRSDDGISKLYEEQIKAMQKATEAHLHTKDQQIAELIRSKHILAIALTVAIIILLIVLGCDLSNGSVGMIRY